MGNLFNGTSFPVWRKSSTLHVLGVSSYKKRCMNAVRCKKIARWLKLQNIPSLFWLHMEKALWEQTTDESIALKLVRQQEAKGLWDCTLYNHVCYQAWWPEFDFWDPQGRESCLQLPHLCCFLRIQINGLMNRKEGLCEIARCIKCSLCCACWPEFVPRIHGKVEEENWLHEVVLWPLHKCCGLNDFTYTHSIDRL